MPKRFNLEVTMSGRCIMMCAGKYHPMEIRIRPDDFVIAVDGGLSGLIRQGIRPDFLLGDFDSLRPGDTEIMKRYREMGESSFLQLPVEKDDTDTMPLSCSFRSKRTTPTRWRRRNLGLKRAIPSF